MQLICFPHAGGFASYYSFIAKEAFRDVDEVFLYEYPGRMTKDTEKPFENCEEMLESVCEYLHEIVKGPYLLLGYSMGGFVAYEAALRMQQKYHMPPELVVIASQVPPVAYKPILKEQYENDAALIQYIYAMGGLDDEIVNNHAVMQFFLKNIRDDFRMIAQYFPTMCSTKKVSRLAVIYGDHDKLLENQNVDDWAEVAEEYLGSFVFDGGHFFVQEHKIQFLELMDDIISEIVEGGAGCDFH